MAHFLYLGILSRRLALIPYGEVVRKSEALIADLITPTIEALGLVLWGIEHGSQGKFSLLRIYIDSENGITIDDCERVSRQVSAILDVEDPITGEYTLEVSSPGMDRPLFTEQQFASYLGEVASVRTRGPIDGRRKFKGKIVEVSDGTVVMEIDGESYQIPHSEIEKAALVF